MACHVGSAAHFVGGRRPRSGYAGSGAGRAVAAHAAAGRAFDAVGALCRCFARARDLALCESAVGCIWQGGWMMQMCENQALDQFARCVAFGKLIKRGEHMMLYPTSLFHLVRQASTLLLLQMHDLCHLLCMAVVVIEVLGCRSLQWSARD